jgi:hypothetical protein
MRIQWKQTRLKRVPLKPHSSPRHFSLRAVGNGPEGDQKAVVAVKLGRIRLKRRAQSCFPMLTQRQLSVVLGTTAGLS